MDLLGCLTSSEYFWALSVGMQSYAFIIFILLYRETEEEVTFL